MVTSSANPYCPVSYAPSTLSLFVHREANSNSLSIQALLGAPNPDDPLANDVAQHWKEDEKGAINQAKEWTRIYAQ